MRFKRGFITWRSMLMTMFELEGAVEEFLYDRGVAPGILLFRLRTVGYSRYCVPLRCFGALEQFNPCTVVPLCA